MFYDFMNERDALKLVDNGSAMEMAVFLKQKLQTKQ